MSETNEGVNQCWEDGLCAEWENSLPLHIQFMPYHLDIALKAEVYSPEELKEFTRNAIEHYLPQVNFLMNILNSLGIELFIGYHVDEPELFVFSIGYSEEIEEFIEKNNIEIPESLY